MRCHSTDYQAEHGDTPRALLNRGFWCYQIPQLMLLCRLLGHVPVVDGTDTGRHERWVVCDRCGMRPQPQGSLNPSRWSLGDRHDGSPSEDDRIAPGSWPACSVGEIGGQLIIGRSFSGLSIQAEVGCGGSEHTLAAHVQLHPLGALYLHTVGFGTWLQRRLNPTGYHSKVIGLSIGDGRLRWELWAKRNESSSTDPKWMRGSVRIDPRDIVLGERRYTYADVGQPVQAMIWMPHGDDHQITLQLQQQTFGRQRNKEQTAWTVRWHCKDGIPVKPSGRYISRSGIKVSDASVESGSWSVEATAAIIHDLSIARSHYGYCDETATA